MGYRREEWDRNAALQRTIMQCGFSKIKRLPSVDDLNPVRAAEAENERTDDFDEFSADLEKAILTTMV